MPPNSLVLTPSPLSQFSKRNQTETKGGDDGNSYTLPVVLGIVFGALTLLVAVLAYRHDRKRDGKSLLSSLSKARRPPICSH